ncbi:MAG: hypothetical protein GY754_09700 [bacterium]|nr:hypothetical protein [bacterium]
MSNAQSILLVEGKSDIDFFAALLNGLQLADQVSITPPKDLGATMNSVTMFPGLFDILMKNMNSGNLDHLGIIADADYVSGGGFPKRWKTLTEALKIHGYRIPDKPPKLPYTGSIFRHQDLPPIGLWIMPDHAHNGMLEDFILQNIKLNIEDQKKLLEYAKESINKLPVKLFSEYQDAKALVCTWLSWQKRPGQTLDVAVNGDLLNLESPEMKGLLKWLKDVFQQ